jgi:PAS domain-containing protein
MQYYLGEHKPMTTKPAKSPQELRRRAVEKTLLDEAVTSKPLSHEESQKLLHELRVHQIELEMQNDQLRHYQDDLETSKSRYFDLYELAPVGYLTLGEQGLILEANLAAATMLGVVRNELLKKSMAQNIFPEDLVLDAFRVVHERFAEIFENMG